MNLRDYEQFYKFLRLSLGLTQEFPVNTDSDEWLRLYQTAVRQSLVGVCWQGVCLLTEDKKPPVELVLRWVVDAEMVRSMNTLQNQEAARLTKLFAGHGRRTAILKGQANARLYPDQFSRQPGDIDIWVEGGVNSVKVLLASLDMMSSGDKASYHHVHLSPTKDHIVVEVHFRPSSGNYNPFTNRRLQRWLEREILHTASVEQGFNVPSVRFALMMQLSHVQRHFMAAGIGLRHVCDYYMLLRNSNEEDRREVASHLGSFGLRYTAAALMWVLREVLHLDERLMICQPDSHRGEWMLREIMTGGNFGHFAESQKHVTLRRALEGQLRNFRMMPFAFWEVLWMELHYCMAIITTLPTRIRYRTLSLRDIPR